METIRHPAYRHPCHGPRTSCCRGGRYRAGFHPPSSRASSRTRVLPQHPRSRLVPADLAKGKILPSYHLIPQGTYSPSGRHSTRAVTSLIDFSPTPPPLCLFTNERVFYYLISNSLGAGHLKDMAFRAEVSPDGTKRPRARSPTVGFLSHGNPWEKGINGNGEEKI